MFRRTERLNGMSAPTSTDVRTSSRATAALSRFARCSDGNGTLSHLFFSDDDIEIARAQAICRTCGLQRTCLDGALRREEFYGVWGGMIVMRGAVVPVRRGRGRPPRVDPPALVVDEVPIPEHLVA